MKQSCPHLHTLNLHYAFFSASLSTSIDACSEFLPNLKILILEFVFRDDLKKREYHGLSKIEILDVSHCANVSLLCPLFKILLEKITFHGSNKAHWFWEKETAPYLHQLQLLHLGKIHIGPRTLRL